jgi:Alpha amylase, catalytic domain
MDQGRREFLKIGTQGTAGMLLAPRSLTLQNSPIPSEMANSPNWTKELVIYEIAPKSFTSPQGPESGTFNSLREKLPYLQRLGINGIWLAGNSLSQPNYFYNIWSQYSNLEPDTIEPTLGTPAEFKSLIAAAHGHSIRVFLDVHVHGVHPGSRLVKEHPTWFRTWIFDQSMVDYDWLGGHTYLDDWWVKIWTECILEYGVDGFRLDINMARPDLWARIRGNAATHGQEIVLFEEGDFPIPGVSDFNQKANQLSSVTDAGAAGLNQMLVKDVPGYFGSKFGKSGEYEVEIRYADGTRDHGSTKSSAPLILRLRGLSSDKVGRRHDGDHIDGIPDIRLTIDNVQEKPIENIILKSDCGGLWHLLYNRAARYLVSEGKPPSLEIYVATLSHGWPSILLSCHDNGWQGFPLDQSPYVAQGSRALFGYTVLFTPLIPIFFAGEECDATFRPIPWMSSHFRGMEDLGKGRWLYGCMLDWNEMQEPRHREMLEDVKTMIAVRKRESDILAVVPDREEPRLMAVPYEADLQVAVPYVRWNSHSAIVIVANHDTASAAKVNLRIPLREIGLAGRSKYKVTDLWPAGASKMMSESDLASIGVDVRQDRTAGGGLHLIKIEPDAAPRQLISR